MSRSSISASKVFTWGRLWRDTARVILLLFCLELICRWGPVYTALSSALDSYENLLWYSPNLPAYQAELQTRPASTIWLVGSSYVMSGLNPDLIRERLHQRGLTDATVQNYGMDRMVNLELMSQVFDRWMLNIDQPRFVVIATSEHNFTVESYQPSAIQSSPYESTYIFPDSFDDYFRGFLFQHSVFYHYTLLARNAMLIPREESLPLVLPRGGYIERDHVGDCTQIIAASQLVSDMEGGFKRLDRFIDVLHTHNIDVLVVNLPLPSCTLEYQGYTDFDDYANRYLHPLAQHLQNRSVPFMELDTRFQTEVAQDTQQEYFIDAAHANTTGSELFSQWTADLVAIWIQ